jgi:hypothetical protein
MSHDGRIGQVRTIVQKEYRVDLPFEEVLSQA